MKNIITPNLSLLFLLVFSVSACVAGEAPTYTSWELEVAMVSASKKVPKKKLENMGKVTSKYCTNEHPITERHGLLDTLVKKVQKSKKVDFISDVKVKSSDYHCVKLEGIGMK